MYTMWAVHCLSALVTWTHLCVSFMLDTWIKTESSIRAVICRCVACTVYVFDYEHFSDNCLY